MTINGLDLWGKDNPILAIGEILFISLILFFVTRLIIDRDLANLARRIHSQIDDIIIESLHPYRGEVGEEVFDLLASHIF